MFGSQASSPFCNGIFLLLMVALFTCNTTLASDGLQEKLPKNRTSSNLTSGGESTLRSLVTPAKRLGFDRDPTFPTDVPNPFYNLPHFTGSDVEIKCWDVSPNDHHIEDEIDQCVHDGQFKLIKYEVEPLKLACYWYVLRQNCHLKWACANCDKYDFAKMKKFNDIVVERLRAICPNHIPSFSCTNWALVIVIIVVLVLVVIGGTVAVVVVCCCCMGGGKGKRGAGGRSGSKRSSNRGSKSKLRKGSSKHRGSSRGNSRY